MSFSYAAFTVMTPEFTPEEVVKILKELNYDGIEWRVHNVPSVNPAAKDFWRGNKATIDFETILYKAQQMRKLSEDNGLQIVGLGTYVSYKHLDDVKICAEAAKLMGCDSIRVATPKYDGSKDYNDLYEEALAGFADVEKIASEYGVRANIELHQDNICCSASSSYRFVSNFDPDNVGVILDPGNMICQGCEGWQMGLELLGPYISLIHIKNSVWVETGMDDGVKTWKTAITPLKEGLVSWPEVLTALDKVGYKGWLTMEDMAPGDTKTKLADDLAYLKSIEASLGM